MNLSDSRKPIVFVLEHQPFDYNAATNFGELKFLATSKLAPEVTNINAEQGPDAWNTGVLSQLRRELTEYIAGHDYVLPTGAPVKMVIMGMILKEKGEKHRLMGWDARLQNYLIYNITL